MPTDSEITKACRAAGEVPGRGCAIDWADQPMMMARRSVHGFRAERQVKNAFEVFEGVLSWFLDVFLRVVGFTHGVDGIAHGAEAIPLRRHDGSWFKANWTLVGRASLPPGGSGRGALGQKSPVVASRSSSTTCSGRTINVVVLPRSRKALWPARVRAAKWPYVGRRCYRAAARLFASGISFASLLWGETGGCAYRVDVNADRSTRFLHPLRTHDPGWAEVAPPITANSSRRPNQFHQCWGALTRSPLDRLGVPEICRWRRPG